MGTEIERKFLVEGDAWRGAEGIAYRQGYLPTDAATATVRVRIAGERAFLTIKGSSKRADGSLGLRRSEFEYEIPLEDAHQLLDELCPGHHVEKTRYEIEFAGHTWEVDEFHGANRGLIMAEVELDDEETEVELPPWAGREVSDDPRYTNVRLAQKPFTTW